MQRLLSFGALLLVTSCGDVSSAPPAREREAIGRSQARLSTSLSVTAGVSGTVTTLAYYSAGNAHPGQNSVDIGAAGGTAVYHQLDYLPSDVAGGWLRTYVLKESGYCSQWSPGSPYYNGAKLIVVTYLYATDGSYLGWHRAAYQHVSPNASVTDAWFRWNNSSASVAAWQSPDVDLGAQQWNGLALGSVFGVWSDIYNGPSGGLCTTGSHLHQEGSGWRGSTLFVGKGMTDRYNDVHLFDPLGGWPDTGAPPYAPEFYVAPTPIPIEEETPRTEEATPRVEEQTPRTEDRVEIVGGAASEEAPPASSTDVSETRAADLEGDEHGPSNEPAASGCTATNAGAPGGWFTLLVAVGLVTSAGARRSSVRGRKSPRVARRE
jgi:hypothetical protein